MKEYKNTLLFYIIAIAIIYFLNLFSPNAHDGGLGFGTLFLLLTVLIILVLIVVNLYRGFTKNKSYFKFALIHGLVLTTVLFNFFL